MKRVMMVYDQIQAGQGTKDDKMVPLKATKEIVGPAVMMDRFLKANDEKVIACVYCGNGTFLENPEEITRKITALATKLKPDIVFCGPAFNYKDYALMAATVCESIKNNTGIATLACMSKENDETIEQFKSRIPIVRGPKKGEVGLNEALEHMCQLGAALADHKDVTAMEKDFCY